MAHRPLILHITGDYPDPSRAPTTVAVKRLIDGLVDCDHVIVSLTRSAKQRSAQVHQFESKAGQRLIAIHHFGLPFGIGLQRSFRGVARHIETYLTQHNLSPDLVHSHRLTFDGIAGDLISRARKIPHVVSVRGEVESKVLRFKPTYRSLIADILNSAHRIYYVSAWFQPDIERLIGPQPAKSRALPNIVANTRPTIENRPPRQVIMTVANLDIYQKKGIDRLIAAFTRVAAQMPRVSLEIIGGGSPKSTAKVAALIAATGLDERIRLRGWLSNDAFLEELPTALALALPSRNETFGMVYTEALFAGVPILYGRNTGIDGHLHGLDVGVAVAVDDTEEIARGLLTLVNRNVQLRATIAASADDLFQRFNPDGLIARYMADVQAGMPHQTVNGAIRA